MTTEEIKFLVDNKINFDAIKVGYSRNINLDTLTKYEKLYCKYVDSKFILTQWCSYCVFEMLENLIKYCESDEEYFMAEKGLERTIISSPIKKRGRPKKNSN